MKKRKKKQPFTYICDGCEEKKERSVDKFFVLLSNQKLCAVCYYKHAEKLRIRHMAETF